MAVHAQVRTEERLAVQNPMRAFADLRADRGWGSQPPVLRYASGMRRTQSQIARRAGVAQSTVSKVLQNPGDSRLNQGLRDRVLQAARELGYESVERRKRLVSYLVDAGADGSAASPFHSRFLQAVIGSCVKYGLRNAFECITDGNGVIDERSPPAGVVYQRTAYADTGRNRRLLEQLARHCPVVVLNDRIDMPNVSSARADDAAGIRLAIEHACGLGHRHIAFLGVGDGYVNPLHAARHLGYLDAMASMQLPTSAKSVHLTSPAYGSDDAGTRTDIAVGLGHFLGGERRPTCIICGADRLALLLLDVLRSKGVEVPRDVSVIGFDNTHEAAESIPRLTSIDQRADQLALAAVDELVRRWGNPGDLPRHIQVDPVIAIRDSVARRQRE